MLELKESPEAHTPEASGTTDSAPGTQDRTEASGTTDSAPGTQDRTEASGSTDSATSTQDRTEAGRTGDVTRDRTDVRQARTSRQELKASETTDSARGQDCTEVMQARASRREGHKPHAKKAKKERNKKRSSA